MKNLFRLALLSAFVLLACLTSFPKPAAARLLCDNLDGWECSSTLTPACAWSDGAWARCICEDGLWNCTHPYGGG